MSGPVVWGWLAGFACLAPLAWAQSDDGRLGVPASVQAFVMEHPALRGRDSEISWAQSPVRLPKCERPARLTWLGRNAPPGRVAVEIVCDQPSPWRRRLTLQVQVWLDHWVALKSLPAGHRLQAEDLRLVNGLSGRLPRKLVPASADWVGKELVRPIAAGSLLELNNLRFQTVIRRGAEVQVKILGQGFEIMTSGVAQSDAVLGATIEVRIKEGKAVQAQAVGEGQAELRMD